MKTIAVKMALSLLGFAAGAPAADVANPYYPVNRPPLAREKFVPLPLGAVKPLGWLKDQLQIQANGLTGHLDEFWPDLRDSAWKGNQGEGWERGPYYLDGLVPLAYLLDDPRLQAIVQRYLDWTLASGQTNGWFGPTKNRDRWPLAAALKVLTQYHEATLDPRVLTLMQGYFGYLKNSPPDWPDREWRGVRAMENVVSLYWLYNRTGDPSLLAVADSIYRSSFDWTGYFLNFPYPSAALAQGFKLGHPAHVVNIAMAIKHPGMFYQQSQEPRLVEAVFKGIQSLDEHHGQVGGRFAGDEHLSGRRPTQGTELCGVVEYMYSLEKLISVLGDAALADRLEALAYNAYPSSFTPDFWAHQYDQQANQVLCTRAKRGWSSNGNDSNLYGLEPNYGCCTANLHQGWPKFVSHLWMATHDAGLVAVAYGPSQVKAKIGDGPELTVTETTQYPFDGLIRFKLAMSEPTPFPLYFRIPGWAARAQLKVNGKPVAVQAGTFARLERNWKNGDVVVLSLPMDLRTETRYHNAVSILRGPLVFSLKISEQFKQLKSYHPTLPVADWEVTPASPWNYALNLDPARPDRAIRVHTRDVGPIPFAQSQAPVVLKVKGRPVPEWGLVNNSAGETPASPVVSTEPEVALELIPYGSTRLRITEFPVLAAPVKK